MSSFSLTILIFNQNDEEHFESVKKVLDILAKFSVRINLEKSLFFVTIVKYLRFEINDEFYTPNKSRLENFAKWETPTTRKKLQKPLRKIT